MHPVEFRRMWCGVTRTERSAAQEHFLELCHTLGHALSATEGNALVLTRPTLPIGDLLYCGLGPWTLHRYHLLPPPCTRSGRHPG